MPDQALMDPPVRRHAERYEKDFREMLDEEANLKLDAARVRVVVEYIIAKTNSFYHFVQQLLVRWRRDVASGVAVYEERDNQSFRFALQTLLDISEHESWQALLEFCLEYGPPLKGFDDFNDHLEAARTTLREWVPPVLSQARGLQEDELTQEDADDLEQIIRSGKAMIRIPGKP